MAMPGTETVRFRRPTTGPNAVAPKAPEKDQFGSLAPQGWKRRHQGLLQDKLGRWVGLHERLYIWAARIEANLQTK